MRIASTLPACIVTLSAACALLISGCNAEPANSGAPDESPEPRLVQVTLHHTDSKGKDHQFALSEKELEAFSKLYPAVPNYRDDRGVKCADAVGLTMKYSGATAIHAHFCGKPTQLHVFRPAARARCSPFQRASIPCS